MITISGIQQVGIGVPDVHAAWTWYRKHFGMDVPIFEEAATAGLMLPYTGGKPHDRHAILAINLQGGGGFEIWQYTSRTPQPPAFTPALGDLGIYSAKIKAFDVAATYADFKAKGVTLLSDVCPAPNGKPHFYLQDPYGNVFEVVEGDNTWFQRGRSLTGGPAGVTLGVTDIDRSAAFYRDILGYDTVLYDTTGTFDDFAGLPNGNATFRRMLLTHSKPRTGAFSRVLGGSTIELVQAHHYQPRKIFENRFWGDLGFIHLCFDIRNMSELEARCKAQGHPFTVDSRSQFGAGFDMGEAAGNFSYIEDPDGALIEFVETHKVPIMKKWGWYLNLRNRDPEKSLPNWMMKALGLNRKKD